MLPCLKSLVNKSNTNNFHVAFRVLLAQVLDNLDVIDNANGTYALPRLSATATKVL